MAKSSMLNIPTLQNITKAWQLIKGLNDTAKQVLVILLMDDLKTYQALSVDPRAAKLVYNHEYTKANPRDNRKGSTTRVKGSK